MAGINNTFRSPLRYPGGKTCLYRFMTKLLEGNDLVGVHYAEPYAGGAGLALRLLMDEYVSRIYINDFDPSIYAVWYVILNRPDDMCNWIESVNIDVDTWQDCKLIQKNYRIADMFELGKATFFLNRTNVSGVISGGPIGGMHQQGKYKMDVRFNRQELIKRITDISRFSHRISLSNKDGLDFLTEIDGRKEDAFIYLDPPYYQKGSFLYMNAFNDLEHTELAHKVKSLRNKWIVSYDNHDFVLDLYYEKNKVLYRLSQCASNRVGDEVIIFDDRIQYRDAISCLNSPVIL